MKELITLIVVFIILALSVYNAVADKSEMHQHHNFFTKMTKFADTGARFTASDGLELCDAINELKLNYEPEQNDLIDCNRFDK